MNRDQSVLEYLDCDDLVCPYCGHLEDSNYDCIYSRYEFETYDRCFINFHCVKCDETWYKIMKIPFNKEV